MLKLTDLRPRWWVDGEGRHGMGVTFDCPHCKARGVTPDRVQRLGIAFANPIDGGPPEHLRLGIAFANPIDGGPPEHLVAHHDGQGHVSYNCAPEWKRTGETFETLTLTPSIDVSRSGHWHGFITNGEIC